jgi:eukaryotic-like serine/threonine-protein kinase
MGKTTTCLTCGTELPPDSSFKRCSKCALSDLLPEEDTVALSQSHLPAGDGKPGQPTNYSTGKEIARGGMGAVLDTQDRKFGRTVAMKVLLQHDAGESERRRFLLEAWVLGQLAHPNIIPVHDLGSDGSGQMFYTMKMVHGITLHDVIQRLKKCNSETISRFPLSSLLTIFRKVCDAMAFAHSRGIFHRDLKSQNIMVGEFGQVLAMEWGLAKILPGSDDRSGKDSQG